jgi:class 3 adenylate cyclase
MPTLPTGTVTFLFTDIEGSTHLLQTLGDRYGEVLDDYRRLLRAAIQERGGQEVATQGDALLAVFPRAREALTAAVAVQRAINTHPWPDGVTLRARMGLHTGEPLRGETEYVGMDVHRAARIGVISSSWGILVALARCTNTEAEPWKTPNRDRHRRA